jgi:hypothetical protein
MTQQRFRAGADRAFERLLLGNLPTPIGHKRREEAWIVVKTYVAGAAGHCGQIDEAS